ncbi:MAG TPA: hypothetical protein VG937_22795 [Polyangiaceae bacterium]|jgi:hypothetical protein|nr:hypothetical protein [Polyangiaceae bacterium]
MTERDPVLQRLAELDAPAPVPELSVELRARALEKLRPRPVHPGFALAVAASVMAYFGWALHFVATLR